MAWAKRNASDFKDLISQIIDFSTKAFEAGAITPGANTGNGTVYGASASHESVAETWTLTCTTLGGNGTAIFSVVGSVSGAKASATSGSPYSIPEVAFTIIAGGTEFAVSDSFTFGVAVSTPLWSVNASDLASAQIFVMLQGVGGGADEIFAGFRSHTNTTTYFNMEVTGFSGYVVGNSYDTQPGFKSSFTLLSNVAFDYYIFVTGRSIKIVPIIGTMYEGAYTGWFLPNATASQFAYPQFVGGSSTTSTRLIGDETASHTNYWRALGSAITAFVNNGTSWININKYIPVSYGSFQNWFFDFRDSPLNRTLYPLEIVNEAQVTIYGSLEGVYAIGNGDSAITPEDVIIDGETVYVSFQDAFRSGTLNVIAMDLIGD